MRCKGWTSYAGHHGVGTDAQGHSVGTTQIQAPDRMLPKIRPPLVFGLRPGGSQSVTLAVELFDSELVRTTNALPSAEARMPKLSRRDVTSRVKWAGD